MKLSEKGDNTLNALRQKLGPIMGTRNAFRTAEKSRPGQPTGAIRKNICAHGFKKEYFFLTFGRVKN